MPEVVVARRGRVAAHDRLAIDLSRYRDVLAGGETENIVRMGESEAVATYRELRRTRQLHHECLHRSVVGHGDLLLEGELLPDLGVKHRLSLCTEK